MRRARRRAHRKAPQPVPAEVEQYFGPATIEVVTSRGTWSPRVDMVGLGCIADRCTIELVLHDREVRPTLPWWLRTTAPAALTLHATTFPVGVPVVRRHGACTLLRWESREPGLKGVLARVRALPPMFAPILARPPNADELAVLRDYALTIGDDVLVRWLG